MRFGYLITAMLYVLTTVSLGTAGCGPAYAGKADIGKIMDTVSAGVDIIDSCVFGMKQACHEQTAEPVKTCMYQKAATCVKTVASGTEVVLGLLGWTPSFRRGGGWSGAGDGALPSSQCVQMLDSEAAALECARGVPTRPGGDCIAERVAECMRLDEALALRVTLAETPDEAPEEAPPPVNERPDAGAR